MGFLNDYQIRKLARRVDDLEEKVFKTARKSTTTRSQQMLLLYELGILDKLNELNLSNKKKADLLSTLLNASADNIEKDLSEIYKKDSSLKTENNYKFLLATYKQTGLKKHAEIADIVLDEIQKEQIT